MLNNLNALEVLYMQLVNNKEARKINNYGMWREVYSTDPNDILNSLITKKVLFKEDRKETLYAQLKVNDLKEILREHSLKVSGKKSDLIERLIDNNINVDIDNYTVSSIYSVTDDYLDVLKNTEFILFFHNRFSIDIFDAYDFYLNHPDLTNHDLIINIVNKNIKIALSKKEYIEAIRMHTDLAKYFIKNSDSPSAQYHVHNLQMLNMISDYERMKEYSSYGITVNSENDSYLFYINDWTLLQYKSILKTRQMSENILVEEILNSTDHLPYDRELRERFANYTIESIYNGSESKKKLMFNLKNVINTKEYKPNTELTVNVENNRKVVLQNTPKQNTKSGCLAFFIIPGFGIMYILNYLINIF